MGEAYLKTLAALQQYYKNTETVQVTTYFYTGKQHIRSERISHPRPTIYDACKMQ